MDCPKCKSSHHVKDGIVSGRQRYKCKKCHYRYTVERKSDVKNAETKRLALALYLEGLGFRSIGRILKISYGTVYVWMKDWNTKITFPRKESPSERATLAKMHALVESKKSNEHYGLLLTDLETGMSIVSVDNSRWLQTFVLKDDESIII
jgi:transposase-like protein